MKKTIPVTKNETLEVTIIDLTHEGLGVAKIEGYPLFIENALPGERATVLVVKTGKQFGYGKVVTLLEKSESRVDITNDSLLRTGIAPLQHMTYETQLEFKQEQVKRTMKKIAKMEDINIAAIIGMEQPFGYRNKAQIPVRKLNNELETGFFRKNSHDLVPIEDYYIQDPKIDQAIIIIRNILRRFNVKGYNERENTGTIRNIIVRRGHYSHQMMIVLVTRTAKLFQWEKMVEEICKEIPEVVSIVQNMNPDSTNVILGKESKLLFGQEYMEDQLLEKTYRISPQSFFQVNSIQAEKLYEKAIELAALSSEDIVIDAYCGIGTIGISLANQVKKVYGIEVIKSAVQDAKINALLNNIENTEFVLGRAEDVMKKWKEEHLQSDVLIVDPPRKGLASSFIDSVLDIKPKKMIYISCNPATMARDCKLLCEKEYQIVEIQPVDLFPMTSHIETVTLLQRR